MTLDEIVRAALQEDVGDGDITTAAICSEDDALVNAVIIFRETGVLAGLEAAQLTFAELDPDVNFQSRFSDGDEIPADAIIVQLSGKSSALLTAERTALNFLQHLSGIATLTRKFVKAVEGTGAIILDTRKTTPGLRMLEKYAVRMGGAQNHRFGLYDNILIKDNHIKIAGGVKRAVELAKKKYVPGIRIEVEAKTLTEVEEALRAGVDTILLDNMKIPLLQKAITLIDKKAIIEISGGVNIENVRQIASLGVNYISVGALTHSAPAIDISMKILKE